MFVRLEFHSSVEVTIIKRILSGSSKSVSLFYLLTEVRLEAAQHISDLYVVSAPQQTRDNLIFNFAVKM